ncbi:MAG: NAD(P)H dehydrogenase assembly family protein [Cyanobacteriota bacterium]|nr:NAD(P)H dehydrogenase assembly family protein [Cyanobacteriota bacterium]
MADPASEVSPGVAGDAAALPEGEAALALGDAVILVRPLPYLKTADPMPMLRPPDLVDADEVGVVRELRSAGSLAVRFRRGTFLIAASDLRPAPTR